MAGIFSELRRRNVFKVGAAYLVVAWLLLQVADVLVPVLSLPEWTTRLIFLLLVVGFIPSLIIAWAYELTPQGLVRDEDAAEADAGSRQPANHLNKAIIAILAISLAGVAVFWFMGRDARWARDEAYPEIERLAAVGDWERAYELAQQVEAVLPGDSALAELWGAFAWLTSIPSNPPGATVYRRPYAEPEAEWEELGTTPLYDIHIPLGMSVLRFELEGHAPLTRVIGGETNGVRALPVRELPGMFNAQIPSGAFDFDTEQASPEGMVRVPGMSIVLDGVQTKLESFHIGRHEVTNREFKEFVDGGGYQRRDLWEHEFILDGETISFEDAMAQFVDRTGRSGASTWEAGTYPDGKGDHPVGGVSWYEAAAYARYAGRELPTVHHWRRAFSGALLGVALPASNLESDGTAPVGQFQGVDWTGAYDLMGNVREWCFNSSGEERVIVGGGWSDPQYLVLETVSDPGTMPPMDRSPINGFRLAFARDEPLAAGRLRAPVEPQSEELVADPVSDEVFAAYLSDFEYDPAPLDAVIEEKTTARHWSRETITFTSPGGNGRLTLYLYLPTSGPSRSQTIIYWPAIGALVLDSIDKVRVHLDFALKDGRAVAFPILDGTFERRPSTFPDWASVAGRDLVIEAVKDMRRTIDYLESRPDIDADTLAYYGFSWGGRLGAIALAVEPRLKVGVLNQAGLQHLAIPETSVLNYLPRVNVPVLQFNGRYDTDFRFETSAKPFFDLIGTDAENKRHVVEPTGHYVHRQLVIRETLDWLDKYLGQPVR